MHAIAYDEIHDEFIVPQVMAQAILVFRGGTNGEEPPIRVIQGSRTQMKYADRVAVDAVHNEIFVPLEGENSVLVFPREASGNVAPIRVLKGPDTQLGASAVIVDPVHDLLIAAGRPPESEGEGRKTRLRIFSRTDQGNVKPRAVIGGPKSGLDGLAGPLAIYPPKGLIVVPVRGPAESNLSSETDFVGFWSVQDKGDVPPRWTIGPYGIFQHLHGVALNPKYKEVIATDKRSNAILTFSFSEIF